MQDTQEVRVQSLGQQDPLEEEMATHSNILAWRIPWTEEPRRLWFIGSERVRHDGAIKHACIQVISLIYITCLAPIGILGRENRIKKEFGKRMCREEFC